MSSSTIREQTAAPHEFPVVPDDHWVERLHDGSYVLIRQLRQEDRAREIEFIRRLSPESRRARFLSEFREPSPALVDQMMTVDGDRSAAFVALVHDDGTLREIGISRYGATSEPDTGECAISVADDWQRRGLGTILMRRAMGMALRHGYRRMISLDAASNDTMHHFTHRLGFSRCTDPDDGTQVIHSIDLVGA
ncbi:GNAT superfamily N-acetyltransferase [Rhodanobacter sp. K2T2]|uniref:GNAT family N-acetyltransferase n=1 Tax=Rhodanobacter sp. K2T2 TaxID=2723085 RepID=UPI0015C8D0C4|nr:GNAT family N-acetyltransferase [Rhodanobacter sp. K2T2]NYE29139.1 GNAT superfamily N-acetyltransferase [Rhodanobacter sp. K2T2]